MPTRQEILAELERRKAPAPVQANAPVAMASGPKPSVDAIKAELARRQSSAPSPQKSEIDAAIEETAASIPGGYDSFKGRPVDPQRMAGMGYVRDPLAPGGYAKPRAADAFETIQNNAPTRNVFTGAARFIEAPVAGLTGGANGGGLEGWVKTTSEDPILGATEAVDFISPVDDAGRAYQGVKQAGAGAIEGDWQKAGEGLKQAAIDGSFTAMQVMPGSMTLKGVTGGGRAVPKTLMEAERATAKAYVPPAKSRTVPLTALEDSPVADMPPPKATTQAYSLKPEPAQRGNVLSRNTDRIAGGATGAFLGGMGDAAAAPGDGNGDNGGSGAATGAALGMFGARGARAGVSRLGRKLMRPAGAAGAAFDERVATKALRQVLKAAGVNADEVLNLKVGMYGEKDAALYDLTQEGTNLATNLSRLPGQASDAAASRYHDVIDNRPGRLEADIGKANPSLNPATISGDLERMQELSREAATPEYKRLRETYPTLESDRLNSLKETSALKPHVDAVERYKKDQLVTGNRVVGDFEFWDLVKRDLDAKEQNLIKNGATQADIRLRQLEETRKALVEEMDRMVPDYSATRKLGGEAPIMQADFDLGKKIMGGKYRDEEVKKMIADVTGRPLTAMQSGAIRAMLEKTDGPKGATAALMSQRAQTALRNMFGEDAAAELQKRFAADARLVENASRINPNVGAVTSQAQGGMVDVAMDIYKHIKNPTAAVLALLGGAGGYSKAQRDLIQEMLLDGVTPENLERIYRNAPRRGGRGPRPGPTSPATPPTPRGPLPGETSSASPTVTGAVAGYGAGKLGKGGKSKAPPPPSRTIPPKRDPALTNLSPGDMLGYIDAKYPPAAPHLQPPYFVAASAIKRAGGDRVAAAKELADYAAHLKKTEAKPEVIENAERTVRAVADVDPIFFDDAAFNASMKGRIEAGGTAAIEQLDKPPSTVTPIKPPPVKSGVAEGALPGAGAGIGYATAPDANGDGVVDNQERAMGAMGGLATGVITGKALGSRRGPSPALRSGLGKVEKAGIGGGSDMFRKRTQAEFATPKAAVAEYSKLQMQLDDKRVELLGTTNERAQRNVQKFYDQFEMDYKRKRDEIEAKMPQWEKDFKEKNADRYDEDVLAERAEDYAYVMYTREDAKLDKWRDRQEEIISAKAAKLEERLDAQIDKWHDAQSEELDDAFSDVEFE